MTYTINRIRNKILCGNALDVLKELPDESIHECITSPPYWTLRSYKTSPHIWDGDKTCDHEWIENFCSKCGAWRGELGTEPTPHLYIKHLTEIFNEVKRVLRKDGTLWVVIGDCYTPQSSHKGGTPYDRFKKEQNWSERSDAKDIIPSWGKAKDLVGIPWRFAFAMQDSGWWLRNDVIWAKVNCMPSSVQDRCVSSHEHCFLFTKSGNNVFWTHRDREGTRTKPKPDYIYYDTLNNIKTRDEPSHWKNEVIPLTGEKRWKRINLWRGHDYFFDHIAIKEPATSNVVRKDGHKFGGTKYPGEVNNTYSGNDYIPTGMRSKRDVWNVATESCRDSHFAVYPKKLIEPMILAGTSGKGVCAICGAPYTRITKKTEPNEEWKKQCGADSSGEYKGSAVKDYTSSKAQNASDVKRRILEGMVNIETVGWIKSCDCNTNDILPAIILDPFFGAGSNGIVAGLTGRDYIGIELNPEFITLAYNRIPREIEKEKIKEGKKKAIKLIENIAEELDVSIEDAWDLSRWLILEKEDEQNEK
jgi:DNA modification methylase